MNIKNVTEEEEVNKGCNIELGLLRIILQDVAILGLRKRRDAAKKKATYLHLSRLLAGVNYLPYSPRKWLKTKKYTNSLPFYTGFVFSQWSLRH